MKVHSENFRLARGPNWLGTFSWFLLASYFPLKASQEMMGEAWPSLSVRKEKCPLTQTDECKPLYYTCSQNLNSATFSLELSGNSCKRAQEPGTYLKCTTSDTLPRLTHPGSPKRTYIEEERVVDSEWELYVAQVPGAAAKVLHTGGTHFLGVGRTQGQIVEAIQCRIPQAVQVPRVCDWLDTEFPKEIKEESRRTIVIKSLFQP